MGKGYTMDLSKERIAITGGAGFLGKFIQARLKDADIPKKQILVPLIEDYDLTKEADVIRMYTDMTPTVVIHLAAEVGGIGANQKKPGRFFYANMAMGLHLIEQGRLVGIKKFVQVGTVCAYPKFTPVPFREDDLWEGYPEETNAPYGIAKKALLVMLQAYRAEYGFNGIFLLPVNLYGPGDNFNLETSHVIPALIRKFVEAKQSGDNSVEIWGSGSASREFFYVDDCARGIVMAAQNYDGDDPINLGAGFEITIKDLAEKIKEMTNFTGELVWNTSKPDGQPRRCLDVTRAKERFGFASEVGFDEGLQRTINWYQKQIAD